MIFTFSCNKYQRWSRGHKKKSKAKDRRSWDQGHKRKCSPKKKFLKKFFGRSPKKKVFKIFFQAFSKKNGLEKIFSANLQNLNLKNSAVLEPRTGQFSRSWGLEPRTWPSSPRTSKRVLEYSTSDKYSTLYVRNAKEQDESLKQIFRAFFVAYFIVDILIFY